MRTSNSKPLTSMTTITGVLLCLTLLTGAILSAPKVVADVSIGDVWTLDSNRSYPIEELLNNLGAGTELNVLPPQK